MRRGDGREIYTLRDRAYLVEEDEDEDEEERLCYKEGGSGETGEIGR